MSTLLHSVLGLWTQPETVFADTTGRVALFESFFVDLAVQHFVPTHTWSILSTQMNQMCLKKRKEKMEWPFLMNKDLLPRGPKKATFWWKREWSRSSFIVYLQRMALSRSWQVRDVPRFPFADWSPTPFFLRKEKDYNFFCQTARLSPKKNHYFVLKKSGKWQTHREINKTLTEAAFLKRSMPIGPTP